MACTFGFDGWKRAAEDLKKLVLRNHGPCRVDLTLHFDKRGEVDIEVPGDFTVMPSTGFSTAVEEVLGYPAVTYLSRQPEVAPRKNGWKPAQ